LLPLLVCPERIGDGDVTRKRTVGLQSCLHFGGVGSKICDVMVVYEGRVV
jgi:hypothetical protein